MSDFVILTDSSADLPPDLVRQIDVQVLPLSFILADHTYYNYPDNRDMDPHVFYDRLRGGETATTNAVNVAQYTEALGPLLQAGKDVLILAFSSGLSATYNASRLAVEELSAQLGVSKSHLVRVFSAEMGVGPGQYLTGVRLDAAKALLARRDYPLEVVATLCGFSGANYLCKVFKKHTGQTPAAFRAQNAGAARGGAVNELESALYI